MYTHNLCFEQTKEKYHFFLMNSIFTVCILHRQVIIMMINQYVGFVAETNRAKLCNACSSIFKVQKKISISIVAPR